MQFAGGDMGQVFGGIDELSRQIDRQRHRSAVVLRPQFAPAGLARQEGTHGRTTRPPRQKRLRHRHASGVSRAFSTPLLPPRPCSRTARPAPRGPRLRAPHLRSPACGADPCKRGRRIGSYSVSLPRWTPGIAGYFGTEVPLATGRGSHGCYVRSHQGRCWH